jgi:adenylate cyclase
MARIERHDLNVMVPVTTVDELGYLSERFNQMAAGLRERDYIRQMFGQYVTTQVAEAVLRGSVKLGGQRTEVTILMTDLRDFTAMCERMEPEELVRLLNRYFAAMIDAVLEFGGTLDKFVGDAIVTMFNAPLRQDDHPLRAVRTALRMREHLAAFNAVQERLGLPTLRMGIGIHTGPAVVGNVGSEGKRVEYTAMGDTVNVAERLESLTKEVGSDICLSAETYRHVRDLVLVGAPLSTRVKGRQTPVTVHSLIDLRPTKVSAWVPARQVDELDQAALSTVRLPAVPQRF